MKCYVPGTKPTINLIQAITITVRLSFIKILFFFFTLTFCSKEKKFLQVCVKNEPFSYIYFFNKFVPTKKSLTFSLKPGVLNRG